MIETQGHLIKALRESDTLATTRFQWTPIVRPHFLTICTLTLNTPHFHIPVSVSQPHSYTALSQQVEEQLNPVQVLRSMGSKGTHFGILGEDSFVPTTILWLWSVLENSGTNKNYSDVQEGSFSTIQVHTDPYVLLASWVWTLKRITLTHLHENRLIPAKQYDFAATRSHFELTLIDR